MSALQGGYDMPFLLERYGARLVGRNRADCPQCGGWRTISYTDEVFFCHRCGFKGNRITLAKQLGLTQRLSPSEYRAQVEHWTWAKEKARGLLPRLRARRLELYEAHRSLLSTIFTASVRLRANVEDEAAWSELSIAYEQIDQVRAELLFLEEAHAQRILEFLNAPPAQKEAEIQEFIEAGGVKSRDGEFLELIPAPPMPATEPSGVFLTKGWVGLGVELGAPTDAFVADPSLGQRAERKEGRIAGCRSALTGV